jgi:Carboxypeptidase regulatory-like domain
MSTNDKGEFVMDEIADVPGKLWIEFDGLQGTVEFGPFEMDGKRHLKGLVVKLIAPMEVTGSVVDSRSKPIAGARVQLVSFDVAKKKELMGIPEETMTDTKGRFVYRGMKAGGYALRVFLRGKEEAALSKPFSIGKRKTIKRRVKVRKR